MEVEQAILTAIEHESQVEQIYREAADKIDDPTGKKVLKRLAEEEAGHLAYLKERLAEWQATGKLRPKELSSAVPAKEKIETSAAKLKGALHRPASQAAVEILGRALDVEIQTSNFYRRMVQEMQAETQHIFARFLEIEEGHLALVRAEINALTGMGVWFDFIEFDLEAG